MHCHRNSVILRASLSSATAYPAQRAPAMVRHDLEIGSDQDEVKEVVALGAVAWAWVPALAVAGVRLVHVPFTPPLE